MPRAHGSRHHSFELDAPLADVLPLFTAEGERAWVPGWAPEILSGHGERGSAFRTRSVDGTVSTWICCRFDPVGGCASYVRIAEGSNIGIIDVDCVALGPTRARIDVTYTLTALGEAGDGFVGEFLDEGTYRASIESWKSLIDAYLAGAATDSHSGGPSQRLAC